MIFSEGSERAVVETTKVRMRPISKEVLLRYVATGDPMDKSGAYSLQGEGRQLIDSIEGDYLAAVGLPLRVVAGLLRDAGIKPSADIEAIYQTRSVMNWQSYQS
jgi:septum formation protein